MARKESDVLVNRISLISFPTNQTEKQDQNPSSRRAKNPKNEKSTIRPDLGRGSKGEENN